MITPELALVIEEAIDSALIDVHTSLPAEVEVFNSTTQTVDVIIPIKRMLEKLDGSTYVAEDLPKITNVPLGYNRTSSYYSSFPLLPGDKGLLIFCETSLDQYRVKGTSTSPSDTERHGLSGAIFVPMDITTLGVIVDPEIGTHGIFGCSGPLPLKIKNSVAEIEITAAGEIKGSNTLGDYELKATGEFHVNDNFKVIP